MSDQVSKTATPFWVGSKASWALVLAGMGLLILLRIPALPGQLPQLGQGLNAQSLQPLGLLLLCSTLPVIGLWRLSAPMGLPRLLSFLYLIFPLATIAVYVVWPLLHRANASH